MRRDAPATIRHGWLFLLLVLLGGCAGLPGTFDYRVGEDEVRYWPPPPESPRFELVGQLLGDPNLPRGERGLGGRLVGWVLGLGSDRRTPRVLQRPQAGFTDADAGRTYVTDVSRSAVFVFDETAADLQIWEHAGPVARFLTPAGIAPGPEGQVLVADADLGIVVRLSPEGQPQGSIGLGELLRPVGVARDPDRRRIFVSDVREHDIKIFSDEGELIGQIGRRGEGAGEFNGPTYLAWHDGRLLVTDTLNSRIQVLDADGRFLGQFGRRGLFVGDMPRPKGVAADGAGNVYVVESYYDHLLVFNGNGELLLPIGGTGSGIGEFYLPSGVWTDQRGRVYVADSFNGRVMIFQFLGET